MPIGRRGDPVRDLVLVEAVPVLVHRREHRLERVRVVVRRDPDVVVAGARGERMLGRVDRATCPGGCRTSRRSPRQRDLRVDRVLGLEERVVDVALAQLRDQGDELRLDLVEDAPHLGGLHLRLEVVEQDVVRLVPRLEAVDVAAAQLDVALERRQEALEARGRLRLEPGRAARGRRERHLGGELGRHPHRLLVPAPGDPHERRVVGVGIERRDDRLELVEEAADRRVDQVLVGEPLDERLVAAADLGAGRRHLRPLVPREQHRQRVEGVNVLEARRQLGECV